MSKSTKLESAGVPEWSDGWERQTIGNGLEYPWLLESPKGGGDVTLTCREGMTSVGFFVSAAKQHEFDARQIAFDEAGRAKLIHVRDTIVAITKHSSAFGWFGYCNFENLNWHIELFNKVLAMSPAAAAIKYGAPRDQTNTFQTQDIKTEYSTRRTDETENAHRTAQLSRYIIFLALDIDWDEQKVKMEKWAAEKAAESNPAPAVATAASVVESPQQSA